MQTKEFSEDVQHELIRFAFHNSGYINHRHHNDLASLLSLSSISPLLLKAQVLSAIGECASAG